MNYLHETDNLLTFTILFYYSLYLVQPIIGPIKSKKETYPVLKVIPVPIQFFIWCLFFSHHGSIQLHQIPAVVFPIQSIHKYILKVFRVLKYSLNNYRSINILKNFSNSACWTTNFVKGTALDFTTSQTGWNCCVSEPITRCRKSTKIGGDRARPCKW